MLKNYKPIIVSNSDNKIQSQSGKVFLELGSLLEGGDEEYDERHPLSKTEDHPVE